MTSIRLNQYSNLGCIVVNTLDLSFRNISVIWLIWFIICFYPITVDGFGVNYLFALTPFLYIIFGGRLQAVPPLLSILGVLLLGIFSIASAYQIDYIDEGLRRIVSLAIFVSIFSMPILKLSIKHLNTALFALIIVSCSISLISIYKIFSLGLIQSAFEAKDEVGSQRVGFLLIFSFWVMLNYGLRRSLFFKFVVTAICTLLLFGIVLTFSRASIVSLIGSIFVYLMLSGNTIKFTKIFDPLKALIVVTVVIVIIFFGEYVLPSMYQFLNDRLFGFFISGRVFDNIADFDTSEGTRIRIWYDIIRFVITNPITGSGFLGSWILGDDTGSSHNQYMDVLFRIGLIGFSVYIVLLWRVWIFLKMNNRFMFCGFTGVLIYGMFHETFKEPGGAFLLSLMLSFYASAHFNKSI